MICVQKKQTRVGRFKKRTPGDGNVEWNTPFNLLKQPNPVSVYVHRFEWGKRMFSSSVHIKHVHRSTLTSALRTFYLSVKSSVLCVVFFSFKKIVFLVVISSCCKFYDVHCVNCLASGGVKLISLSHRSIIFLPFQPFRPKWGSYLCSIRFYFFFSSSGGVPWCTSLNFPTEGNGNRQNGIPANICEGVWSTTISAWSASFAIFHLKQ